MSKLSNFGRRLVNKPGASPLPTVITAAPPIVDFNETFRLLTARSNSYDTSQIEYRQGQNDSPKPYSVIQVDNSAHEVATWQFRIKAGENRLASSWAPSSYIYAKTVASPTPTPDPTPAPTGEWGPWVEGEIPYNPQWAFAMDVSNQDFTGFFDKDLQGQPNISANVDLGDARQTNRPDLVFQFPESQIEVELSGVDFGDGQHDSGGNEPMHSFYIAPQANGIFPRVPAFDFNGQAGNGVWQNNNFDSNKQAVAFVMQWVYPMPTQVRFRGRYRLKTPPALVLNTVPAQYSFGAVSYIYDFCKPSGEGIDLAKLTLAAKASHFFRLYIDIGDIYDEATGLCTFQPMRSGGWSLDDVLTYLTKTLGKSVTLCLKGREGATYYPEVAKQLVIRYGNNKNVPLSEVKVFTGPGYPANQIKIGLGVIAALQVGNEQTRWWKGDADIEHQQNLEGNMTIREVYDQHKKCWDLCKAIDPTMIMCAFGTPSNAPGTMQGVAWLCKLLNNGVLVFDEVAFHMYMNSNGGQNLGGAPVGVQPELNDVLYKTIIRFHRTMQWLSPNKVIPVKITETGYSTQNKSDSSTGPNAYTTNPEQTAVATPNFDIYQTALNWGARTNLECMRAGLAGCATYQQYHDGSHVSQPHKFGPWDTSNGIFYSDINGVIGLYPESDGMQQMKELLFDYYLVSSDLSNPLMIVNRFVKQGAPDIYSLHLVTHNDGSAPYMLPVAAGKVATLKTMDIGIMKKEFYYTQPQQVVVTSNDYTRVISASHPGGNQYIFYQDNYQDYISYTGPFLGVPGHDYRFGTRPHDNVGNSDPITAPPMTQNPSPNAPTVTSVPPLPDITVYIDKYYPNSEKMISAPLVASNGAVQVTVTERPCFVVVG
jgi:hypothetical protein